MEQDEKNFMDRYMAAFSKFTDAQAKGEDVNQVFADMKKNMTGAVSDKELEFMNKMADPGPSADYTTGPIKIPEGVDASMFNEIPIDKGALGGMPDKDLAIMQGTPPNTIFPIEERVSPMGSMINNVDDFLSNLGRKVGQ
jgi:hypothetical protein